MHDSDTILDMASFSLGHIGSDGVAILFGYATSQQQLSSGEISTFVIGMSRENAIQLGEALIAHAKSPPPKKHQPH